MARWLLASLLLTALSTTAGCAWLPGSDRPDGLPRALDGLWADYRELPDHRALALAGELRRQQWVAGASGGHTTRVEAEVAALRECRARRKQRGIVAACQLYAEGDRLVGAQGWTRGR